MLAASRDCILMIWFVCYIKVIPRNSVVLPLLPFYRCQPVFLQPLVAVGEMMVAEPSAAVS